MFLALLIFSATSLASCQSTGENGQGVRKIDTPRGIPAIGSTVPRSPTAVKSAMFGVLSGVLAGGAIGNYLERQERDRAAAAIAISYLPEQGEMLKIESVEASPGTARRGEVVNLTSTYTILNPNNRPITIRETREVRHQGLLVGNSFIDVQRTNGTFTSTLPITLPRNTQAGSYEVTTTVSKDQQTSQSLATFTVQ